MNDNYQHNNKRASVFQLSAAVARAVFILLMGFLMLLAVPLKITQIAALDEGFRYLFGGICILYGGFRLYRGIKGEVI